MTVLRTLRIAGVAALIYGVLFILLSLAVSWSFPIPGPPTQKVGIHKILDAAGCVIFDCLRSIAWILPDSIPTPLAWFIVLGFWTALAMIILQVFQMIKRKQPNKAVDSTASRVTPLASSLRSGQESHHGQP